MKKIFKYLEPMWLGSKNKVSIRRVLAIVFSIDFIGNVSYVIRRWDAGKSVSDASMLLGIEAGLIAALLALTTYTNTTKKSDYDTGGEA